MANVHSFSDLKKKQKKEGDQPANYYAGGVGQGGGGSGAMGGSAGAGAAAGQGGGASCAFSGAYPAGPYAGPGTFGVGDTVPDRMLEGYVNPTAVGLANTQPLTTYSFDALRKEGVCYAVVHVSENF